MNHLATVRSQARDWTGKPWSKVGGGSVVILGGGLVGVLIYAGVLAALCLQLEHDFQTSVAAIAQLAAALASIGAARVRSGVAVAAAVSRRPAPRPRPRPRPRTAL
jgi:hypothetical protein